MTDLIHRFLFDDCPVRGEHLLLDQAFAEILSNHHYPPQISRLIGEFCVCAGLLSAVLKFDGRLTVQARSEGEIPLIMAEATSGGQLRAIARGCEQAVATDFATLLTPGQLCLTIDPEQGQRYQGIVNLEGDNLAAAIEQYFAQSEQLSTRLWLACDGQRAAGLMLQEMPAEDKQQEDWERLSTLASTVTAEELLSLPAADLLTRLYHQEQVRLFPPRSTRFHCSCSRERFAQSLRTLGAEELHSILREQGQIDTQCEFCNSSYRFDKSAVQALLTDAGETALH